MQWLSILLTLLTAREKTAMLLLRMLLLVFLESAVDELKIYVCEKRGIPVRGFRPNVHRNVWFVLALVFFGTSANLALLNGIRADCFIFGPH